MLKRTWKPTSLITFQQATTWTGDLGGGPTFCVRLCSFPPFDSGGAVEQVPLL